MLDNLSLVYAHELYPRVGTQQTSPAVDCCLELQAATDLGGGGRHYRCQFVMTTKVPELSLSISHHQKYHTTDIYHYLGTCVLELLCALQSLL